MRDVLIIDGGRHTTVRGRTDGDRILLGPDALEAATGWRLKPEGLCRDDVCVPVRDRDALVAGGDVDVAGVAAALRRLAVVDAVNGVAALGDDADARSEQMATLAVPEVTLPDLDGNLVDLHAFDRRKVLLLAWSSW